MAEFKTAASSSTKTTVTGKTMTTLTIPKKWALVENPDLRLLEGATAPHANRFIRNNGDWWFADHPEYSGFEMLEVEDRIGEPVKADSSGAAVRWNQDGMGYARNAQGVVISTIKHYYYSFWQPLPGLEEHDICGYCGSDNGANSEYRNGYDCGVCGSN